jgi:hypothetical protein
MLTPFMTNKRRTVRRRVAWVPFKGRRGCRCGRAAGMMRGRVARMVCFSYPVLSAAFLALLLGLLLIVVGRGMRQRRGLGGGKTVSLDGVTLTSRRLGLTGRPDRLGEFRSKLARERETMTGRGPRSPKFRRPFPRMRHSSPGSISLLLAPAQPTRAASMGASWCGPEAHRPVSPASRAPGQDVDGRRFRAGGSGSRGLEHAARSERRRSRITRQASPRTVAGTTERCPASNRWWSAGRETLDCSAIPGDHRHTA